jgi:signal transduction histidine kinase
MVPLVRLRVRSLYLKVVIPILLLVLAGLGGVSLLAMNAMRQGVRLVAEQRAHYGLAYVRNVIEEIGNNRMADRGHLQTSLERLNLNPDVDVARILSTSGKVLYSSRPPEIGQIMAVQLAAWPTVANGQQDVLAFTDAPDVLHASTRIVNRPPCTSCHPSDQHVLAVVDVDISLSRQRAGMRTWSTMASTAAIAQLVVVTAGIILILGVVVVRPIQRLAASMNQVQHGNLSVSAEPHGTEEIDGLVNGFNDMVGRLQRARHAEQEAQRGHLARVEQLATLGEVAASLAHEIRNPLAGTKAAIDVLAGEEKDEEPRRILRHISEELRRVDGVVRQLLGFAKPKAPVLAQVDLRTIIDAAVLLGGPGAAAQGAAIAWQRPSEPLDVLADADLIQQVVVNLLINALQAVRDVTGATVTISADARDGAIACSVRDNGPGVPADRSETIFRPFVTTKTQGTGLGLATSRRLIERHRGRLWLENPGQPGACFTFTLPRFVEPQAEHG